MSLNGKEIRTLRQRLGWSVAEMARRMGCGTALIETWEADAARPDPDAVNQLRHLQNHAESSSHHVRLKPQVEKQMEEKRMSQLTHRDCLKDVQ